MGWALKLGLVRPLLLVIDAFNLNQHPAYVGTALDFLRQPRPAEYLRAWRAGLPFGDDLCALGATWAASYNASEYMRKKYAPMSAIDPVKIQMLGLLEDLPLVALASRRIPAKNMSEPGQPAWFDALRTWCLIQHLEAAWVDMRASSHLNEITSKLRIAIDEWDAEWIEVFWRLRGPAADFHELTNHLASQAPTLLVVKNTPSKAATLRLDKSEPSQTAESDEELPILRSSHIRLLRALKALCDPMARLSREGADSPRHGLHSKLEVERPNWNLGGADTVPFEFSDIADDIVGAGALCLDTADGESNRIVVPASTKQDQLQQERRSRSVLLASAEDYQYLCFSWNRPNPHEREALREWIKTYSESEDTEKSDLAAAVWIAAQSGHSLATVVDVKLETLPGSDWALDIHDGRLHRQRPTRYSAWRAEGDAIPWVETMAPHIDLALPPAVQQTVLRLAISREGARSVGDLFGPASNLKTVFRETCLREPGLSRIWPGMLSKLLEQQLYEQTGDPAFAQLIASRSYSGLPAHCAYAAFSANTVKTHLSVFSKAAHPAVGGNAAADLNAAGSELLPLEDLLELAFDDARKELNVLANDPGRWREHHNAITTYSILILLAATAGRPVNSPFQDPSYIDLERCEIFVADKASSATHAGRLLPLPMQVAAYLMCHYIPHLKRVSRVLFAVDKSM